MNDIYVTGHRNPDTDAIVAAIAYANLRQALGERNYIAARIGAVNDETKRLLDRFEVKEPVLIKSMRTQVCDLDYDRPPTLTASVTIDLAWKVMKDGELNSVPIVKEDGTLYGMLSTGDVADYDMATINSNRIDDIPLFNLLSVIEGTLVNLVFPHIPTAADIHSYRADYAGEIYITHARPLDEIPREDRYCCRKDKAGIVYDKKAMRIVSNALGHNRLDVIAQSYLWTLEP